jgi:hypothetical protein
MPSGAPILSGTLPMPAKVKSDHAHQPIESRPIAGECRASAEVDRLQNLSPGKRQDIALQCLHPVDCEYAHLESVRTGLKVQQYFSPSDEFMQPERLNEHPDDAHDEWFGPGYLTIPHATKRGAASQEMGPKARRTGQRNRKHTLKVV